MSASPSNPIDATPSPETLTPDSPTSPLPVIDSPDDIPTIRSVNMGSSPDLAISVSSGSSDDPFLSDNSPPWSPYPRFRLPSLTPSPESRMSPVSRTRKRYLDDRERLIQDNADVRDRLRKAKLKIPVSKGEDMYCEGIEGSDSMAVLMDSVYKLTDVNDRMVLREKRYAWYAQNKDYACSLTAVEEEDLLYGLGLLSPYELSDGDEPDDDPSS